MTERKDDGGPAYPVDGQSGGMSLRDWFAGMALQGLVASNRTIGIDSDYPFETRAKLLFMMADAMLNARK